MNTININSPEWQRHKKSYSEPVHNKSKLFTDENAKAFKKMNKRSKVRDEFFSKVEFWAKSKGIKLEKEYQFAPPRKFRFDLYLPEYKIGFEYNGIFSQKSRHISLSGYSKDLEKINLAQINGYKVLQYTALNMGEVFFDLQQLIKK
jgi:hypothetical protein